ncbi:DUF1648 domain-containing protein [Bacillus kwashiorkori]|uniref:DUF1648 domain-containing protein n=1 Tax=Bacillus kwashiorkori TaxID=1522318 RepID=UPI0007830120|nr:DUF1648 domain-containing protein [Bacillus kwashiorkori]
MSNNYQRPKLKIPKTTSEKLWDIVGLSIFLSSVIFLIFVWNQLPDKVPAHYNFIGEIDRWGSKWELILSPSISLFMLVFLQILERFPETHNYPARLNDSNVKEFYLHSRKFLNLLKNLSLVLLSLTFYESVFIALQWWNGFGPWFLPITIIVLVVVIVNGILQQRKIR